MTVRDSGQPDNSPPSPCVRNCCLDDKDVCIGCGRTLDEIRDWSGLDEAARREVLTKAERRRRQRPSF